ncbi:MAG: hypothetical protein AAB839_02320, partial [Patescibacteria group bacterium]
VGTSNDGSYAWTAPNISQQNVSIRAQATDLVTVLDSDTSDAFSIGTNDTVDTDEDTDTSEDGDTSGTTDGEANLLPEGTFMRSTSWSTVYYIGADGTRRPFLDAQTFFTYADNFDGVIEVTDDYLANYMIGAPMLAKAGTVLVKVQSLNEVYAVVDMDGVLTLRWIMTEDLARSMYGTMWADYVIDVPVTAWPHFELGEDIDSAGDIETDLDSMRTRLQLSTM